MIMSFYLYSNELGAKREVTMKKYLVHNEDPG